MWVPIKKKYVKIIQKNMFTAFACDLYCTVYKTLSESTILMKSQKLYCVDQTVIMKQQKNLWTIYILYYDFSNK